MMKACLICESDNWLALPDPAPCQSVTTSSRIVPQPLGKSACMKCGLVQRVREAFLGLSSYYEEDYANYYERPGTEAYHLQRYQQLTGWMRSYLIAESSVHRVLDVGCGQGWAMDALAAHFPNMKIFGIEPSEFNAAIAKKKGYEVFEGKIENLVINDKFDVIYSNNVIQHVNDPVAFLTSIKGLLRDDGVIIITCPDGSKPNIELLFSDHNYSFLPGNLCQIGHDLNFDTVLWDASRENPSLPPAQLLLLTNNTKYAEMKKPDMPKTDLEVVATQKKDYLNMLKALNEYLTAPRQECYSVYNLGASFWTSVLAAYCPNYWDHVEACVVDNKDDAAEFMGKKIIGLHEIAARENALIVLGTSPATHEALSRKMQGQNVLRWDAFYKY